MKKLAAALVLMVGCGGANGEPDGVTTHADSAAEMGFDTPSDVPDAPPKCGDLTCNGTETCETCPRDCGVCPKCDKAPTCTGAVAIPTTSKDLPDFDNGGKNLYSCGVGLGAAAKDTTCLDPRLRIRIRQIKISKIGVWPGDLDMYCIVNASDGATSEVAITPLQKKLGDGASLVFDPSVALFWGQKELHTTINNLTVTYKCLRNTDLSAYTKVAGSIKDEAIKAGGVAGPWGWAFGLGGVAAGIVEAALGASGGDTLRLSVQQTIDAGALLEMTNGRIWRIQQSGDGGGLNGKWDWTIEVESWGCADARPLPK